MEVQKTIKQNISCEFAKWVSDNFYEDTFQDIDNDGCTWTNHNNEDSHLGYHSCKRYTIEEIYSYFLIETKRV